MASDSPKTPAPTKCRGCRDPLGSEPTVRRGRAVYHDAPSCLDRSEKPHRGRSCGCEVCEGRCVVCRGRHTTRARAA